MTPKCEMCGRDNDMLRRYDMGELKRRTVSVTTEWAVGNDRHVQTDSSEYVACDLCTAGAWEGIHLAMTTDNAPPTGDGLIPPTIQEMLDRGCDGAIIK